MLDRIADDMIEAHKWPQDDRTLSSSSSLLRTYLPPAEQAVRIVITGLGLMVGISWERAFEAAYDAVVKGKHTPLHLHPVVSKFVICLVSVVIVGRAWYYYIIPLARKDRWEHQKVIETEVRNKAIVNNKELNADQQKALAEETYQMFVLADRQKFADRLIARLGEDKKLKRMLLDKLQPQGGAVNNSIR